MADTPLFSSAVTAAPDDYTISAGPDFLLKTVAAAFNGTGASGPYLPAVQLRTPSGAIAWTAVPETPVAAGASVVVSWFPGGGVEGAVSTPDVDTAGITALASPTSTITVTNPTGPTADVDLPTTGVTAGTYGDATHVAEVTVDAEGRVTTASSVPISGSGGAGGLIVLYDSGYLGSAQASFDTGAGGIASGHFAIIIVGYLRSAASVSVDNLIGIFNNDSSALYQVNRMQNVQTTYGGASVVAQTSLNIGDTFGALLDANQFSSFWAVVPAYDGTSNFKSGTAESGVANDVAANSTQDRTAFQYKSASAISRFKLTLGSAGNFVTGSRLIVYGMQ